MRLQSAFQEQYRERIDVVSHLDVVAPGDGWLDDPFSGAVSDGAIHGRGRRI